MSEALENKILRLEAQLRAKDKELEKVKKELELQTKYNIKLKEEMKHPTYKGEF